METERTLQALIFIWHELPELLGSDWLRLYPKCRKLLTSLHGVDQQDGNRHIVVSKLAMLFQPYGRARQRLGAVRESLGLPLEVRGPDIPRVATDLPAWNDLRTASVSLAHSPSVRRYTDVSVPANVGIGEEAEITVSLKAQPGGSDVPSLPLEVAPSEDLTVHLWAQNENVEVAGDAVATWSSLPKAETEPARFVVRGKQAGKAELALELRQLGRYLGGIAFQIEVATEPAKTCRKTLPASPIQTGGEYAPPVDLELVVRTRHDRAGQVGLAFVAHSPNGVAPAHYLDGSQTFVEIEVARGLQREVANLRSRLSGLEATRAEREVATFGRWLYDQLFPSPLKALYLDLRERIHILQIISDEPWIPWELLRPFDPRQDLDDDFLCARYQTTRWLTRARPGARSIEISKLVCVTGEGDAAGEDDRLCLDGWLRDGHAEDHTPQVADRASIEALIDNGDVDLWHFAARGSLEPPTSAVPEIGLRKGGRLRTQDLYIPRSKDAPRPLVFLNVRHSGWQTWSLSRTEGWPSAWIRQYGCGALVAPLWSVDDKLARRFAHHFYEALREGKTVAEAVHEARQGVRGEAPADPTWLAYSVYAFPNAYVI